MKHVIRGLVLLAVSAFGLSLLGTPALAEDASSVVLDEGDQRIFAKLKDQNPWYDPMKSGGGGLDEGGGGGIGGDGGGGAVVPEPGTIALLGLGLASLGVARRRQKAKQNA